MKFKQGMITIALGMLGGIATVAMLAAVPGIFSFVNSTSGYQVNGAAGSAGNALCSDGTYYDVPCSVAGSITSINPTSPLTGGGSSGAVSIGLGTTGTAGTYADPSSVTTDVFGRVSSIIATPSNVASGWQNLNGGMIFETGSTGTFDTGPITVSITHTFPTACLAAWAIDTTTNGRIYTASCTSASTITVHNNGSSTGQWFAVGY